LERKWRNCLTKAEQNGLEIVEGADDGLFAEFIEIYQELVRRKGFKVPNDINEFRMIQRDLPGNFKMRIFLCRMRGAPTAGAVCAAIGETGLYIFGATNAEGLTSKSSYLVQWKALQALKSSGCNFYNLNGINPLKNPGTYHFKAGVANKNGKDVHYLGRFDCYSSAAKARLARLAEQVLRMVKRIRAS
jgi:lipid II:glycine glycyltransferase (peptidoglycan interpeptide bridge formation enzyme)